MIKNLDFPHENIVGTIHKDPDFIFMVNALRDADMLQNMNDTQLQNLVGIKAESFRHLSWDEYGKHSLAFLESIKFKTDYGITTGTELQKEAVARLGKFANVVFGD